MAKGTRQSKKGPKSSAWITRPRRYACYMRDGFTCMFCGADLSTCDSEMRTLDHLVSVAVYNAMDDQTKVWFGSVHKSSNLATCCKPCNSSRQDRISWQEFAAKFGVEVINNIYAIVDGNFVLDIEGAKWILQETRKNYANCWKPVNGLRLSQGVGSKA